jgi:hypothetical protein
MLLAAQGLGLVPVAQVSVGDTAGWTCTCGCCRNSPGHHCPMCVRVRDASAKCDCAAGATRDIEFPWWFDVAALLPACDFPSHTIAVVGDLPLFSSALSEMSRRPLLPPPRPRATFL